MTSFDHLLMLSREIFQEQMIESRKVLGVRNEQGGVQTILAGSSMHSWGFQHDTWDFIYLNVNAT